MLISRISFRISAGRAGRPGQPLDFQRQYDRKPARCQRMTVSGRMTARASRAFGNSQQIQPTNVCGHERQSGWLASAQNVDLLPKHEDFCFQRRPRSKQIDDETKYQSDETQHPAQRRPILYDMPTGFNLRQGQVFNITMYGLGFGTRRSITSSSSLLRCCGSIEIDEGHQLFRQVGEQLEFSGVQRLAQQLKQESVRAVREGRSQAAEEKAETAGGIRQERKTGIADRCGELHGAGAQGPHVAQRLAKLDGGSPGQSARNGSPRSRDRSP